MKRKLPLYWQRPILSLLRLKECNEMKASSKLAIANAVTPKAKTKEVNESFFQIGNGHS